jgi:hypothetical protein
MGKCGQTFEMAFDRCIALLKIILFPNERLYCKNLNNSIDIDIFVNCNWVASRWQLYSTYLHTNNMQNDTKQTIHRTTQKF